MKSKAIVSLLSLVPLALSAPVPIVLVQDLASAPSLSLPGAHPPAPVALRPGQRLPAADEASDEPAAAIDNRPVTPSGTVAPSLALASPQPVATTYLMVLNMPRPRPTAAVLERPKAVVDDQDAMAAVQSSTTTQMELGIIQPAAAGKPLSMPCYLGHLAMDYTDMLAISLVATFLVIIVLVETWDAVCLQARWMTGRQGTIRLENDDEARNEKQAPLSVQASPPAWAELNEGSTKANAAL